MSNDNLALWDKVEETPAEIICKIPSDDGSKELSTVPSINRLKKATGEFGMYGVGWGLKDIKHDIVKINNLVIAVADAIFWVDTDNIKLAFEISSSMGIVTKVGESWSVNPSYRKALESDVINKALSRLGFFADIYSDNDLIKQDLSAEDVMLSMDLIDINGEENGSSEE